MVETSVVSIINGTISDRNCLLVYSDRSASLNMISETVDFFDDWSIERREHLGEVSIC